MEFRCEDLPQFGLILVPSTSPEYAALYADVQQRMRNPIAGSPPWPPRNKLPEGDELSAILINRSPQAIASIEQIWTHRVAGGREFHSSVGGASSGSVLLPFGVSEKTLKLYGY